MTYEFLQVSREDHVTTIRLNRPEALNALSGAMADEIAAAFHEVSDDPDTWVVVLAAAGEKAFCVGADLKERNGFTLEQFYENRKQISGMFEAIRKTPQPVVASVFGFALGGGFELVLSCDVVVAAEGTELGLPEVRVGLLPAGGGTQLLARKVGIARAKDMILRGKRIDTECASGLALVNEVCERGELEAVTKGVAADLCKSSPVATRAAKASIDAGLGGPIDDGIEIENDHWKTVIASADREEGIAAFNEKRDPDWKNA